MSNKNLNKITEYRIFIQILKDIHRFGIYSIEEIKQLKSEISAKAEIIFGFDVETINNLLAKKIQKAFEQKCYKVGVLITPPGLETI